MIKILEHVRTIYRSKQPIRRVKVLNFTNFDFMGKESPFAPNAKPKLTLWQRAKQFIQK